jgi:hypothetical protein
MTLRILKYYTYLEMPESNVFVYDCTMSTTYSNM